MQSQAWAYIFHVALPIWVGGMIYLTLRQGPIPFLDVIKDNLIWAESPFWQPAPLPVVRGLPNWFSTSLPDALWCYACVSLALICWRDGPRLFKALWLGIALTLALGFELGQGLQIIPGTFCTRDVVFSAAAAALAIMMACRSRTGREP
jgi:hypothetical protein